MIDPAPTTNGELAEAWGMDSGSAVPAYLESALADLYHRGEDGRIRPTERATSLVGTHRH